MKIRFALPFALLVFGCGASADELHTQGPSPSGTSNDASSPPSTHSDAGLDATSGPLADGAVPPTGDDSGTPDASFDANGPPPGQGPLIAYASGYGPNINVYVVDKNNGALTSRGSTPVPAGSPSFAVVNKAATNLYALSEVTAGRVTAFAIDPGSGALTYLNDVSSKGDGPAHVSVDATGKWVLAANYGDGTVSVLPVLPGGKLGDATDSQNVGANAHMAAIDLTNKYVFVPCLGAGYVAQFSLDQVAGKLVPSTPAHVKTAAGSGPRHIAFHPNGKLAYLVNETNSTITAYSLDGAGHLTEIETQSTLPKNYAGPANTGAEVWVHPTGNFVYASNRGDDSIAVFTVDAQTGKLTFKANPKSGGKTPRYFALDPAGAFLYAANQDSSTIVRFTIDPNLGTLSGASPPISVTQPSSFAFGRLP